MFLLLTQLCTIAAARLEITDIAHAAVESFVHPSFYNIFDLNNFSFKHHVEKSLRVNSESELKQPLLFLYTSILRNEVSDLWESAERHNQSPHNYTVIAWTRPPSRTTLESLECGPFVPNALFAAMAPLLDASNSAAIIFNNLRFVGEKVPIAIKQELRVFGWQMHCIIDFCAYACVAAWQCGRMTPNFVPFDFYEFLDISVKVGYFNRNILQRAGYHDRYEVKWEDDLGMSFQIPYRRKVSYRTVFRS